MVNIRGRPILPVNTFTFLCIWYEDIFTQMRRWNTHEVTLRAVLYYQWMCAKHIGEQISEGDLNSVAQISCTTACHSTAALLQTWTSTLTLHRDFLLARYLSMVSNITGEHERYLSRMIERNGASHGAVGEGKPEHIAGRWGAAYIFGGRKFSASLVNGQNDSSRHIICLDDFLYSIYSKKSYSHSFYKCYSYSLSKSSVILRQHHSCS